MSNILFIKPHLETDATWENIRTGIYLGMWYMASKLKEVGHNVKYLDEVMRNNGMEKTKLYETILDGDNYTEHPLNVDIEEYRKEKNEYFNNHTPKEFVDKYTAFSSDGKIKRVIARIGNSIEDTLEEIAVFKPDFICISLVVTTNVKAAIRLGKAIKEKFQKIKIIYGGQHVSALYLDFVKENPWIDYVVVGDGIKIINNIVEGKVNDKILIEGFHPMGEFPRLDYDIISDYYAKDQRYCYPSFGRKSIDFMFSKGCFRKCEFCFAGGQKGNHASMSSWDQVEEELKNAKNNAIEELIIQDDAFIFGPKDNLVKKMELMKKYDFFWQDSGGIDFESLDDFVTDQFIQYNKTGKGRLTAMYIPFNPRIWNKSSCATKSMVEKYKKNFHNLKRLREEGKIHIFTSEIIGAPDHTVDIIKEEIEIHKQMINEGYIDKALTLSATFLPGTKWYENHGHNIINKKDIPGYSFFATHHKTKNIPDPKLIEELVVFRTKELNMIQSTYNWQTAFPNTTWEYKD